MAAPDQPEASPSDEPSALPGEPAPAAPEASSSTGEPPEPPGEPAPPAPPTPETSQKSPARDGSDWVDWPLDAARASLTAWIALALVNAVAIEALVPWPAAGISARITHHIYDASQLLAAGLLSHGLARLWSQIGPRHAAFAYIALLGAAFTVAHHLVPDDAEGFVLRRTQAGSQAPWPLILSGAVAATIPIAAAVGRLLARPWLRAAAVLAGLTVAAANQLYFPYDYASAHLFAAWSAATLIAASLTSWRGSLKVPTPFTERGPKLFVHAVLATLCALAILLPPRPSIWRDLQSIPGAVFARLLARAVRPPDVGAVPPAELAGSPWFKDRSTLGPIPPTKPAFLPQNGNVILLTVDALRHEVTDGRNARTLPTFEQMRTGAIHFPVMRTPSPATMTSIYGMFTGKYYSQTYWSPLQGGQCKGAIQPQADESPRVPSLLTAAGVKTIHVVGLWGLSAECGAVSGFSTEIKTRADHTKTPEMMGIALDELKRADPNQGVFLYMHLMEPHAPYDLAGSQGSEYDRYVREVSLVDRELGRLFAALRETGADRRTVVIVTADHGEAFGEHNTKYHSVTVYEEQLRVPLFMVIPNAGAKIIDTPVTLLDVGATLLDLFGQPIPSGFMGESLLPLVLDPDKRPTRPVAAESARLIQAMTFPDGYKIIRDVRQQTTEIYDLTTDPAERKNLVDLLGSRRDYYNDALRAFFEIHTLKRPGYSPPFRHF